MDKEKLLLSLNDRNGFLENYMKDNLPKLFYRTAFNKKISKAEYIHQYEMSPKYKKKLGIIGHPMKRSTYCGIKLFQRLVGFKTSVIYQKIFSIKKSNRH